MTTRRWTPNEMAAARQLLEASPIPRDRLPYTPEFEEMYERFRPFAMGDVSRSEFWRLLMSAAKKGGLAKFKRNRIAG